MTMRYWRTRPARDRFFHHIRAVHTKLYLGKKQVRELGKNFDPREVAIVDRMEKDLNVKEMPPVKVIKTKHRNYFRLV